MIVIWARFRISSLFAMLQSRIYILIVKRGTNLYWSMGEPLLVSDRTSSGHDAKQYCSILVTSTGHFVDQYWFTQ